MRVDKVHPSFCGAVLPNPAASDRLGPGSQSTGNTKGAGFLTRGLQISITDERGEGAHADFHNEGGITDRRATPKAA